MTQPATVNVAQLVRSLLDQNYTRATAGVLRAIAGSTRTGIIARRLDELDAESQRLSAQNERLRPDNPVLTALLSDLRTQLDRDSRRIDGIATNLQVDAAEAAGTLTRQLALPGLDNAALARLGVQWNTPDPEAVNDLINRVDSAAWQDELAKFTRTAIDTINNQAVRGLVEGWSPLRTARELRRVAQDLPAAQANTLMRTLQLTSYRSATAIHQQANAAILTEQIRIAALDDRTCLACIALHGQRLPIGERINDHHNGRCTSVAVVTGRPVSVRSGEEWFNSLPPERQIAIAGPGKAEALRTGQATLADFVQPYEDDVFGAMIREASIKRVLG